MRWSLLLVLTVGCAMPNVHQKAGVNGPAPVADPAVVAREVQKLRTEFSYVLERLSSQQQKLDALSGPPSGGTEASLNQRFDQLAKEVHQLQSHTQDLSTALKRIQLESINPLEQRCDELARVRQDVEQLVRAVEGTPISTASARSVKVRAGDTLEKIARANGATVEGLVRLNRLKGDRIHVGQTLLLP